MQLLIRRYRPSDRDAVLALFSAGVREYIHPCFQKSMTRPRHLAITLALCAAGYHLGSVLGAVFLPGLWMGLVYYCCYHIYAGYVGKRLQTDMRDIPGNYLSRPDDCFWVAEAEVDGRVQVMATVAVLAKQRGRERYWELLRLVISPGCRRAGLGSRMTRTVVDFCQERGFSKVALETSSNPKSAVALYEKLGFCRVLSPVTPEAPSWVVMLGNVTILKMEKQL